MPQHLLEMSLSQRILKLKDEKKIVTELNTILEEHGCKTEFFNLNLDLIKEENQILMLPCCYFHLSWQETHRLLDYYDGNFTKIFGEEVSSLPEKDTVQFFIPCRGELFPDSLQDVGAIVERTVSWPRTVLRPVGLADKLFTVSIVQMYSTASEFLGKRQ